MKRYTLFLVLIPFSIIGMEDNKKLFKQYCKQLYQISQISEDNISNYLETLEIYYKEIQQLNEEYAAAEAGKSNTEPTQITIEKRC